jgi:acyl carrier protein
MSQPTISERVSKILIEQLGVDPSQITPEAKFNEDLGADSLDSVEIVMACEEEFNVEVPDEEAEKIQTVGGLITYLEENHKE